MWFFKFRRCPAENVIRPGFLINLCLMVADAVVPLRAGFRSCRISIRSEADERLKRPGSDRFMGRPDSRIPA
jgi:hypothetical protein